MNDTVKKTLLVLGTLFGVFLLFVIGVVVLYNLVFFPS